LTLEAPTRSDIVEQKVAEALADCSRLPIGFENAARYNDALRRTFSRTVAGVHLTSRNGPLNILEVGAFTAVVSVALKRLGHDVTASDMPFVLQDQGLLRHLQAEGIKTCPHDLSKGPIPLPDSSFDVVIFNEVLEHLNFNCVPLLRDFARLLRPGGTVYCGTPNLASAKNRLFLLTGRGFLNPVQHLLWALAPNTGMSVGLHWREWTKRELTDLFEASGFKLSRHHYCLYTDNTSPFPRRALVGLMYRLCPALMPGQVGVFVKQ